MSTIIIHPGIGKTGTTAIQQYAWKNFMQSEGVQHIAYSPAGLDDKGVHNAFADNHPSFNRENFSEALEKLIQFSLSSKENVFISSEFLIRASAPHIKYFLEKIRESNINVKVIVSVRNYTDYLISSYLQAVKVKWGMKHGESLPGFCLREIDSIRMPLLVDQWSRVIGDENVMIFDYDKYKKNLLGAFFSAVAGRETAISGQSEVINSSIKLSYAKVLLEFDRACGDLGKREQLVNFLNTCDFNAFNEDMVKDQVRGIVKNQYTHDFDRLQARYSFV